METSRARIRKAINHIQPELTPVNVMGFEDIQPWLRHFGLQKPESGAPSAGAREGTDFLDLCRILGMDALPDAPVIYRGPEMEPGLDIWGAVYSWAGVYGSGYSAERGGYPLAKMRTTKQIEKYRWPRADDFDYSNVSAVLSATPPDEPLWIRPLYTFPADDVDQTRSLRSRRAEWLPILCTLFNLFGMEETLVAFSLEPKRIEAALSQIEGFILEFLKRLIASVEVDGEIFWFGDDFASQTGMLISPDQWRRYLKPVYRKVFSLAKAEGMKVWFHSCGTFRPVFSDLIEIGMDIWETAQVHLPGNEPEVLKREYGKDITFYGAINSQTTLPHGTPQQVRAEVRERVSVLGKGGGYICSSDHAILPDVPFENVLAMIDEAKITQP